MKVTFLSLSVFLVLGVSSQLTAQDYIGKWKLEADMGGEKMVAIFTTTSNGYSVDFDADGTIDINGDMVVEGDQITIQDKPGPRACEEKGVYTYTVENDVLTLKIVKDECEDRGVMGTMVMKRM